MLGLDVSVTGLAAMGRSAPIALPDTGLLADWRFEEGSGTTVADQTGSHTIDLTAAASPNTTWHRYMAICRAVATGALRLVAARSSSSGTAQA